MDLQFQSSQIEGKSKNGSLDRIKKLTKLKPLNRKRVLSIVQLPYAHHLNERHVSALLRLIEHYSIKNLSIFDENDEEVELLCHIMVECVGLASGSEALANTLAELVKVLCPNFYKMEAYDQVNTSKGRRLLDAFGELLRRSGDLSRLSSTILHEIQELSKILIENDINSYDFSNAASCDPLIPIPGLIRHVPKHQYPRAPLSLFTRLLSQSSFVIAMTHALGTVQLMKSKQAMVKLLHCVFPLCKQKLSSREALEPLFAAMAKERDQSILLHQMELLWAIIEVPKTKQEALRCIAQNEVMVGLLSEMWTFWVEHAYQAREKQLRNDITALFMLCVQQKDLHINERLLKLICNELSQQLLKTKTKPVKSTWKEDMEHEQLLIKVSFGLCGYGNTLELFTENRLLDLLLDRLSEMNSSNTMCPIGQQFYMQSEIIDFCIPIMSHASSKLRQANLAQRVTALFQKLISDYDDAAVLHVRARDHLLSIIVTLIIDSVQNDEDFKEDFGSSGCIETLVQCLTRAEYHAELISLVLTALPSLCKKFPDNQTNFGQSGGVESLIAWLKYDSPDEKEMEKILTSAIACTWECVAGHAENVKLFVNLGGVNQLLNMLALTESSHIQLHTLGCLLDLLENPRARKIALEWQHPIEEKCLANILIQEWCRVEKNLGIVDVCEYGIMQAAPLPLIADLRSLKHPRETKLTSEAISELNSNLRVKIFATFSKLGFDMFDDWLTTKEKIKLMRIQKYLDFKISEIWHEIDQELKFDGVRPVTPDQECLRLAQTVSKSKADSVCKQQMEIAQKQHRRECKEERQVYTVFLASDRKKVAQDNKFKRDSKKLRVHMPMHDLPNNITVG